MTVTKWTILALLVLLPLQLVQYVTTRGMIDEYRQEQQLDHLLERAENDSAYALLDMGVSTDEAAEVFLTGRRLSMHAVSEYDKVSLDNGLAALFLYEDEGFSVYRRWDGDWILAGEIPYESMAEETPKPGVKAILRQDK